MVIFQLSGSATRHDRFFFEFFSFLYFILLLLYDIILHPIPDAHEKFVKKNGKQVHPPPIIGEYLPRKPRNAPQESA